jgi:hypothetical protein
MFQAIIEGAAGEYSEYVIMPVDQPGCSGHSRKTAIWQGIYSRPGQKAVQGAVYPFVCQDFERDIYRILKKNRQLW